MKILAKHWLVLCLAPFLTACVTPTTITQYDLSTPATAPVGTISTISTTHALNTHHRLSAITLANVSAPAWMNQTGMSYRLAYAANQEPRLYAYHRWNAIPTELFQQRLKNRLTEAGGKVLNVSDGVTNLPILRIELDDFSQIFSSPTESSAHLRLRASLFHERTLLGQATFTQTAPAPTPDAAGGARAMATASDAAITDILSWMASF